MEFLYRDEHLVAVNKPPGLLVHRSPIDRHETRFALQLVRNRLGRHVYPVHRLDRPTSGVLLFALSPMGARRLREAYAASTVVKTYLAVVRGVVDAQGVIDHPLVPRAERSVGRPEEPENGARQALTHYHRLASVELPVAVGRYPTARYSLVCLRPVTGRRHQLRRHLKHLFHPIIGDTNYGDGRHNRFFREAYGCSRLLLAAVELTFPHPDSGVNVTVTAPLDAAFALILERLGLRHAVPSRWLPADGSSGDGR